jgi:hypothetical protein
LALTPELPDRSISTEKHQLQFGVEVAEQVAKQYGIVFKLT